jgi:AcrR family transcriptional regulator
MMEEDIEISEELEAFIEEQIEAGLSEEEIAQAIEENFELVSEEDEVIEEEAEEAYAVDMSEHVEALFAGEDLSEEFKEKAKAIFEAAVQQKLAEEIAMLEEAYAETLEEQVAQIQEELSTNVDDYLNYVVEQWVSENEVAIEAGLRSELTEEFISGLRNLFAEHYIDIPEDKVSVVEEMTAKVAELEEKLNEEIDRNVHLNKVINEATQNEIVFEACEGLTTTQAEKLKALSEGIEFTSVDEYAQKINILRESYFNAPVSNNKVLDNNEVENDGKGMISESLQGPMANYVKTLGRTLPK